jgi:Arylsulfotransferase (ASST)
VSQTQPAIRASSASRRWRRLSVLVLPVVVVGALLAGCLPPPPPPTTLAITTTPGLYPTFDRNVADYVARCGDGAPVTVSVAAPNGTLVSVDGKPFASGRFTASVTRTAGQDFAIVLLEPSRPATTHFVRCLPTDFPVWYFQRTGDAAAGYTLTRPIQGADATYPMILDRNGVPVWWGPKQHAFLSQITSDGHIVSVLDSGAEERTLAGGLVRSVPISGGVADGHDFALLPNGHFVLIATIVKSGVNLTSIGGPAGTSVFDQVIEEIDPGTGNVVWTWDPMDHIAFDAMDPQWRPGFITGGAAPYDVFHWNSIQYTGDGYLLSFRHLDAVYKIDATTGDVAWKLGGTPEPASLSVVDDPVFTGGSHFGGQHDARLLADGTVSLHDNGTNLGRAPRAVRYSIDTGAKTATLVETVTDPGISSSFCCGSARKVADGDWLVGWGGTGSASELVGGQRRTAFAFPGLVVYRIIPIDSGVFTPDALRVAMDAQFPDFGATEAVDPGQPLPFPP